MLRYKKKHYKIYNMYGPTEATVIVTFTEVTEQSDNIPIGMPIDNTKLLVIKDDGTPAELDEQGEICIMGSNLSSGYLNNKTETEKRFVPSVIDSEKIMYRTGDAGMWTSDKQLLCFGRIDFQIKHRGFRIELDEIRYRVLELEDISDCAVLYKTHNNNGYIVCFYCTVNGCEIEKEKFDKALEGVLPEYMIPAKWIRIDRIPLNNSGKTDRNALMEILNTQKSHSETHNDKSNKDGLKTALKRMWADILDIDEDFDESKNFRELGGHSILCMMIIRQIREELNIEIDFNSFMNCKDFKAFAALVSLQENMESGNTEISVFADSSMPFRLNRMQTAYVVGRNQSVSLGSAPTHLYYEAVYTDSTSPFDIELFLKAANTIFELHDMLRIRINNDGNQHILPFYKLNADNIGFTNLSKANEDEKSAELISIRAELETYRPLIESETLIKVHVVQTSASSAVICAYMDSIIIDGWSAETLLRELNAIYSGKEPECEKHHFQEYNAYLLQSMKSAAYETDREYWTQHLPEMTEKPCLLLKTSPDTVTEFSTRRIDTMISNEDWNHFKIKCQQQGLSSSAVMYGVLGCVIAQYSLNSSFTMSLPIQKRYLSDRAYDMIGNCTSFLLFTYKKDNTVSWNSIFRRTYEQITERLSHDTFCGMDIMDLIRSKSGRTDSSAGIMFTSLIDYCRTDNNYWNLSYVSTRTSQVWLDMIAAAYDSGVHFIWSFVKELFEDSMADSIAENFQNIMTLLCTDDAFWNSTPEKTFGKDSEFLPLSENDLFTKYVKENISSTETELFCLKNGNMKVQTGAIGKICHSDGTVTEYDGVCCGKKSEFSERVIHVS